MNQTRKLIFEKTNGLCHFCGDKLDPNLWHKDHINQKAKGGANDFRNFLPAHPECNRARWCRTGREIRKLIQLGIIAKDEIYNESDIGLELSKKYKMRKKKNKGRRNS